MTTAVKLSELINGNSSQIVVPSGGVNFGTSTDGSGTVTGGVLDDYEEGTFTAAISTYTGATAPSITYQNTSGKSSNYTKIGNIICISVSLQIDTNSATTIDFSGLPFTVSSGGGGAQIENNADSVLVSGIVAGKQDTSNFRWILTGTGSGNARNVSFGFFYRTA